MKVRSTQIIEAEKFVPPHRGVRCYESQGVDKKYAVIAAELEEEYWDAIEPGDYLFVGGGGRLYAVDAETFVNNWEVVEGG